MRIRLEYAANIYCVKRASARTHKIYFQKRRKPRSPEFYSLLDPHLCPRFMRHSSSQENISLETPLFASQLSSLIPALVPKNHGLQFLTIVFTACFSIKMSFIEKFFESNLENYTYHNFLIILLNYYFTSRKPAVIVWLFMDQTRFLWI